MLGAMAAVLADDDVVPLRLASVVFPDFHPLHGERGDVLGFAIRHRRGIVLFDTGIGFGSALVDRFYQPERRTLADALAEHGHQLADVTAVVNSHLHFDHCGNNHVLPGVPIYAQSVELELARAPRYTVPDWVDFPGAEYRIVVSDARVADGIRVISTPGHTGGHQSVVLDGGRRPVVLAGQAIYSKSELERRLGQGASGDDDETGEGPGYLDSVRRILDLRPRRVHFSHDAESWSDPA